MKKNKDKKQKIQYTNLKLKIYVSKKDLNGFNPKNLKISEPDINVSYIKDDKDPSNIFTFQLSKIKENFEYENISLSSEELSSSLELLSLLVYEKDNNIVINANLKNGKSGFKKDSTRILELSKFSNENEKEEIIKGIKKDIELLKSDKYTISDDLKDLLIFPEEHLNTILEEIDKEDDDLKIKVNEVFENRKKMINETLSEIDAQTVQIKQKMKEQAEISKEKFEQEKSKQKEEIEAKFENVQKLSKIFNERLEKYIDVVKEETAKRKKYVKLLSDKEIKELKEKFQETKKEIKEKIKAENKKVNEVSKETPIENINKKENINYKNKYEKLLESTTREKEEILKYKSVDFIKEMLPGLDMLNSSINSDGISEEAKKWFVGFEMIVDDFKKILKMEGVEEIKVKKGDAFNSEYHLSIDEIETDEVNPGEIVKVDLVGYLMKGRLLRPATVTIAKQKGKK